MKWILQVVDQPRVGEKKQHGKRNDSQLFSFFSVLAVAVRMTKMKSQTNGLKKKNRIFPMMNMVKKRPAVGPAWDFSF